MASRPSIEMSAVGRLAGGGPSGPAHVAIIMDGNRRWARARGMPPVFGHQRGAEAVRRTVEGCRDWQIRYLTLFAFSTALTRPLSQTWTDSMRGSGTLIVPTWLSGISLP